MITLQKDRQGWIAVETETNCYGVGETIQEAKNDLSDGMVELYHALIADADRMTTSARRTFDAMERIVSQS